MADHEITSNLKINSVDAAVQGLGITAMVKTTVYEELRAGKLIPILDEYELEPRGVYALYPHREHLPPKVRIFMDFLEKYCARASWSITN